MNEYRDELIAMNLAGEANLQQIQELSDWVNASTENAQYYAQLKTLFEASSSAQKITPFDTDTAWLNLHSKIHSQNKSKYGILYLFQKYDFLKAAAGLLLLLGLTYFLNLVFNTNNSREISFKADKRAVEKRMADGSVLHLNKKSSIQYSKNFNKSNRKVILSGEAFFEVIHNEKLPFTVAVDELLIEDVGTSFNVNAYPDKESVEVSVLSGEVKMFTENEIGISLSAGESASYNKRTKLFAHTQVKNKNLTAYKDKIFVFENTALHTVIAMLNDVYQSSIVLANPKLNECQLTVSFENESLDKVVDVIAATFNLKVTKTESGILLEGDGCGK